jgi:hypothetical protein
LSVIGYVEGNFISSLWTAEGTVFDADSYNAHPQISDLVRFDDVFLTTEAWERVEETALLSTEFVDQVSDEIMDANLKLNGVSDGILSYRRVVKLLLKYYDGVLY